MQMLRPLVDLVSRVPARVQVKLLAAFLAIAGPADRDGGGGSASVERGQPTH